MAKTNADVDRDDKREEILRVAKRLFVEDGYEATSIARIAQAVRVAPNTLYWYFTDKDALLLAVLDLLVTDAFVELDKRKKQPLDSQLQWMIGELDKTRALITTVHARVASVEPLRVWHDNFHRIVESTIEAQLRAHGLMLGNEAHAARVTMFVVEGLLAHPTSPTQQRALLKWLVSLGQPSTKPRRKRGDNRGSK